MHRRRVRVSIFVLAVSLMSAGLTYLAVRSAAKQTTLKKAPQATNSKAPPALLSKLAARANPLNATVFDPPARLAASNGTVGDDFGFCVAVSGDTAIVGTLDGTVDGVYHDPHAYIFVRSGSDWTEKQIITPPPADVPPFTNPGYRPPMDFGRFVAISGDTAIVTARNNPQGDAYHDYLIYFFVRDSNGNWPSQPQQTIHIDTPSAGFAPVAVSGQTLVVGERILTAQGLPAPGSASIFVRQGSTWVLQQQITSGADTFFGYSVAISGDTVVIGSPADPTLGNNGRGSSQP